MRRQDPGDDVRDRARPGTATPRPGRPGRSGRSGRPGRPPRAALPALLALLALPVLALPAPGGPGPAPVRAQEPPRRITLREAIRLAGRKDPDAVAARSQVGAARAGLLEARGSWLPSLSVGSAYVKSSSQRVDQATGRFVTENYTAQATAGYDLFVGGRRLLLHRAAAADVAAAEAQYRSQRFQTALATTRIFYEAAASADLSRLAEERLERARQQLEFARTRLDLGTATSSDALRAELEQGNAELALLDARSALRRTALALGRQVGLAEEVHPVAASLPEAAPPLPPTEELVRTAVLSSPAVLAAEARLRGRRAERLAGWSSYLPAVRFSGGYDWYSIDFPPERRSWNLRLSASLPLFDGFSREAALQRAGAARAVAEAEARDARIAARVEVESAVQEIDLAAERVRISDHARELAAEDLRVQEERYQLGAATILDLQTSQVALTEAEVATVRARQALGTAVATLEAVLGQTIGEVDRDQEPE